MTVMSSDQTIELQMPSFLMPPINIRHRERASDATLAQIEETTKRLWFPRHTIRLRLLHNVFVAEEGLVLHADLTVEPSTVRVHRESEVAAARSFILAGVAAGTLPPALEGDIVLCKSSGIANYGHWLVEMLPIAYVATQHWPHPARFMIHAVDGHLANIMQDAYSLLGISESVCIKTGRSPVLVERLVIVEGLTHHGLYVAPIVMECLDTLSANIPADPNTRLFVSRGAAPTRRLSREHDIVRHLQGHGFISMAPGSATFSAQVAAFKGARKIVGVMGANLTNVAFATPGAEAIMLAPMDMPDTFFWFICGLRGVQLIDYRCRNRRSDIGDPLWDGVIDLDDQDEEEIVAAAIAPPSALTIKTDGAGVRDLFSPRYYMSTYGNSVPGQSDPLEHYCTAGWLEGFDPSDVFSTSFYLAANPDVAATGMCPLLHYIEHGMTEGRWPRPL